MSLLGGQLEWVWCAVNSSSPSLREWAGGPGCIRYSLSDSRLQLCWGCGSYCWNSKWWPLRTRQHGKEGNKTTALRCRIDVWLHWELGNLEAFFKKKKISFPLKKINKVGSVLEIRDFVKAIVASVSGVFHSLGSLEKANPLLSILTWKALVQGCC